MVIEIYRRLTVRGMRFDWRARHHNGNIMATSGTQGYSRQIDCLDALRTLRGQFADATVFTAGGVQVRP